MKKLKTKKRNSKLLAAVIVVAFAVLGGYFIINSFGATPTCTTTISPGADVVAAYSNLTAGQTLCLRAGSYAAYEIKPINSGTSTSPITLMSYPGERATLTVNDIYIPGGLAYHNFMNLNILPSSTSNQAVTIQISSNNSVWQGNDISGINKKTCMIFSNYNGAVPRYTLVKDNKFHDCGDPAHGNQDHAIYLERSVDATITENVFWNTAAFAIHLYSDADNTIITHNVIDSSGYGAVIFASDQNVSTKTSDNNTFAYNMVTNGPRYGMTTYWGPAGTGIGNTAHDNCTWGNTTNTDGLLGVAATNNVQASADPYASASIRNYTLKSGSNCLAAVQYDAAAAVNAFFASASTTCTSTKPSDINCDNNVNIADLSILLSNYSKTTAQLASSSPSYPRSDINTSGKVDIGDLSMLLTAYGQTGTTPTYLFQDEFNATTGAAADTSKWILRGEICDAPANYSCPKNSNIFHDGNGNLVLRAKREPTSWLGGGLYSGAWLSTFAYGSGWPPTPIKASTPVPFKIEMRAIMPSTAGGWPSIWMMSVDRNTSQNIYELDVAEERMTTPTSAGCHQHTWLSGADKAAWDGSLTVSDMGKNWHVYSANVYTDRVEYKVDGLACGTAYGVSGQLGIILNNVIATPGSWGAAGGQPATSDPGPWDFLIDYIRVSKL